MSALSFAILLSAYLVAEARKPGTIHSDRVIVGLCLVGFLGCLLFET